MKNILFFSIIALTMACTKTPSTHGTGSSGYSKFKCICSYQNRNYTTYHVDTFFYAASQDSFTIYQDCSGVKTAQEQQISPYGTATCLLWK